MSTFILVCGFEPADQDQPGALTKFLDAVNWVTWRTEQAWLCLDDRMCVLVCVV